MPHRSLPGTIVARLQDGFILSGALFHRGVVVLGLRSLDQAFTRQQTQGGPRELRKPIRTLARLGYWMLGGVTTGNSDPAQTPERRTSKFKDAAQG